MEYEISIRINFSEKISAALKQEKDRFVKEYGSSYKSDPHITLYLDRYTKEGFEQLPHDLHKLQIKPFAISLLKPEIRREDDRHRNLYVMDVSNKELIEQVHDRVSEMAIRYRSPFLREKVRQRLERQGIHTDGKRECNPVAEVFDPHITLGEIDFDKPQAEIAEVQKNLQGIEGRKIIVASIVLFFYEKKPGAEKARLTNEISIPLQP